MPRAPKTCGRLDCLELSITGKAYCVEHEAERQALMNRTRGQSQHRGYDAQHRREAKQAKAQAVALGLPCARCGEPVLEGQALQYGHVVARAIDPTSRASVVEHAHCGSSAQHRYG